MDQLQTAQAALRPAQHTDESGCAYFLTRSGGISLLASDVTALRTVPTREGWNAAWITCDAR